MATSFVCSAPRRVQVIRKLSEADRLPAEGAGTAEVAPAILVSVSSELGLDGSDSGPANSVAHPPGEERPIPRVWAPTSPNTMGDAAAMTGETRFDASWACAGVQGRAL